MISVLSLKVSEEDFLPKSTDRGKHSIISSKDAVCNLLPEPKFAPKDSEALSIEIPSPCP